MRRANDLHNLILDFGEHSKNVLTVFGVHKHENFPIFGQNLDFDFYDLGDFKEDSDITNYINGIHERFSSFLDVKTVNVDFDFDFYQKMKKYNFTTLAFFYSQKLNTHK